LRELTKLLALKGLIVKRLPKSAASHSTSLYLTGPHPLSRNTFSINALRSKNAAGSYLIGPDRTRHTDLRHPARISSSGTRNQTLHPRLKLRADTLTSHSSLTTYHCPLLGRA
jgi:hypothetical protein